MIQLLSLGVPGSPPAAMLLGALMLNGVNPGPMLTFENPEFIPSITAILLNFFILSVLYAIGLNEFNLFLIFIIGIRAYILTEQGLKLRI